MEPWSWSAAGSVALAVVAALAVLGLPGLPAVLALRLRPLTACAVIAPISLAMIAISAELGRALSIPWSILLALVLGLALGAVVLLVRLSARGLSRRRSPAARATTTASPHAPTEDERSSDERSSDERSSEPPSADDADSRGRTRLAVIAGLVLGGITILVRQLLIMGSVDAVSQTYDNVWHLSAIRRILNFEDGSAWLVGGMTSLPGNESYYPALWHQAGSLVVQLSGQEIVLSSNVLMLVVGAVLWPVGLVALVRSCTSAGPLGLFLAGALSGISAAFPLGLMSWGIVLPYFLSMAMMPVLLLCLAQLLRLTPAGRERLHPGQLALLIPVLCLAIVAAHSSAVFVALVLALPVLVWAVLIRIRTLLDVDPVARPAALGALGATVLLVLGAGVVTTLTWTRFSPPQTSAVWEPNASLKEAVGQVASLAGNGAPTWVPLGLVMGVAVAAALLWSRERWLVAAWAGGAAISVAARCLPVGDLRYLITGNWYSDTWRLVAIPMVAAVPVLAVGIDALVGRILHGRAAAASGRRRAHVGRRRTGTWALVLSPVLAAVLIAVSLVGPSARASTALALEGWAYPYLLSDDERALLEQLPEVVPEDAVIATNAWNGSSLAYAISDRQVLNIYMGFAAEPPVHLLNAKLDDANTDPEVCDAMVDLHVDYALDFGPDELFGRQATYTGLNEISETGAAEEVLRVGDASLWRMLPCRGTDGSMKE
ncbi:DUF6541 family protein [Brachybacterium sp. DNPG3]